MRTPWEEFDITLEGQQCVPQEERTITEEASDASPDGKLVPPQPLR